MIDEELNKNIEALRAERLRLQELRKTTEERLEALTNRMDQIKAEMAKRKSPIKSTSTEHDSKQVDT